MFRLLFVVCLVFVACITPSNTLSCVTGVNTMTNSVCPLQQGMDTCMKLDLGNYVSKTCVPSVACSKRGLESYVEGLSDDYFKNLLKKPEVIDQLTKNVNSEGRQVINCCKDVDYCNSGIVNKLSVMTIFGIVAACIIY